MVQEVAAVLHQVKVWEAGALVYSNTTLSDALYDGSACSYSVDADY